MDEGEIGEEAGFEHVLAAFFALHIAAAVVAAGVVARAVEHLGFFAIGDDGADAGGGEKRRNSSSARTDSFGECALRIKLDLEFAAQVLLLERCVFANVTTDHLLDLARLQEQAQTKVIHAGVVADARKVLNTGVAQCEDEVLGDAAEAKPADHDGHSIAENSLVAQVCEAGIGVGEDFVAHV